MAECFDRRDSGFELKNLATDKPKLLDRRRSEYDDDLHARIGKDPFGFKILTEDNELI